jgi:hypothetical protein
VSRRFLSPPALLGALGLSTACSPEISPCVSDPQATQFIEVGVAFAEHLAEGAARAAEFRRGELEAGREQTLREPDPAAYRASSYSIHLESTGEGTLVVFSPPSTPGLRDGDRIYLLRPGSPPDLLDPGTASALHR